MSPRQDDIFKESATFGLALFLVSFLFYAILEGLKWLLL